MNLLRCSLVLFLLGSLGDRTLAAQSFSVRGDPNGDGEVTISDAFFLNAFMFAGSTEPECIDSGDVDGNAKVDISDTVAILAHLFLDGPPPCHEEEGSCELETATPAEVGSVEILDASIDANGQAVLTIGLTSEEEIGALDLSISAGDAFAEGQVVEIGVLQGDDFFKHGRVRGHELSVQYMTSIIPPSSAAGIPAGEAVPVLEFGVCLTRGTPAGDVELEITRAELTSWTDGSAILPRRVGTTLSIPRDVGEEGCEPDDVPPPEEQESSICEGSPDNPPPPPDPPPPVETGEENDFLRGDANQDGFISISDALTMNHFMFLGDNVLACNDAGDVDDNGRLEITDPIVLLTHVFLGGPAFPDPYLAAGADPTSNEGLSCIHYEPSPPATTDDIVRIGDVEGNPGDLVDVPVFVSNSLEVEAYQMILGFDPEVFSILDREPFVTEGTFYASQEFFFSVASVVDNDKLVIGVYPSFLPRVIPLPPGEDQLVFKLRGRIDVNAEPGTTMTFDTTVGEEGFGPLDLHNELTHLGQALFFGTRPRLVDGHLKIAPDITIFVRGDASDDGIVDQSDGIFLLQYLFLRGERPPCPDAADANDDGDLDVSDPIAVLQTVFRGLSLIAAPYPEAGPDPSPDSLGKCEHDS